MSCCEYVDCGHVRECAGPATFPPQNPLTCVDLNSHLIHGPCAHPSPHPKRHVDRFSRFCRAGLMTDRRTDRPPTRSVTIGHIYVVLRCGLIIPVITFMVLSSWQSHCESSPVSFDECRLSDGWPPSLRPSQRTWPAVTVSPLCTRPPSPFIIITPPESRYSFYRSTEGGRLNRPTGWTKK